MLVLLRSTTACNLRCRYCSAACGEAPRHDLSENDCRLLLEHLPPLLHKGESVAWLWHGGEPTLLPPEKFAAMQSILSGLEHLGHPTRCLMQTNGYVVTDAWLDVLTRFRVGVGVSLDGPAPLHDAMRVTASNTGSYHDILKNLEAMRQRNIAVSLLCTARKEHMGRESELLDWLESLDLPIRFNPLLHLGRSSDSLSPADYYSFLRTVFSLALERQISLSIEPLEWMLASVIADAPPRECSYNGQCGISIFSYGPGGDVGSCNRSDCFFGNLHETPLHILRKTSPWHERCNRTKRLQAVCATCSAWPLCHGGCPEVEGDEPIPGHCNARKNFFFWLRSEGLDMYRDALLRRRERLREHLRLIRQARAGMFPSQKAESSTLEQNA